MEKVKDAVEDKLIEIIELHGISYDKTRSRIKTFDHTNKESSWYNAHYLKSSTKIYYVEKGFIIVAIANEDEIEYKRVLAGKHIGIGKYVKHNFYLGKNSTVTIMKYGDNNYDDRVDVEELDKETKKKVPLSNRIYLSDNSYLRYEWGYKDPWCVFYVDKEDADYAPYDKDYFMELKKLYDKHKNLIYQDFLTIYHKTSKQFSEEIVDMIKEISNKYQEQKVVQKTFAALYMAMIAEFYYPKTILEKRIKGYAVRKILIDNEPIDDVIDCTNKVGWKPIKDYCQENGL